MEPDDIKIGCIVSNDNNLTTFNTIGDWANRIKENDDKVDKVASFIRKDGKLYLRISGRDVELDTNNPTELGETIIAEYAKQVLDEDEL